MKIRSYIFKSISLCNLCRKVDSNSMIVIARYVCANRLDLSRGMSKFLINLWAF